MDVVGALLPLLILLVAFYLLVMRPARARQAKALATQAAVEPGAEVMTTAGIFGRVVDVDDDGVMRLEIADGVVVRYLVAAVAEVRAPA